MQRRITALWALLGTCRGGDGDEAERAAAAAGAALAEAHGPLRLHLVDGALWVDGAPLHLGIDLFTAAQGLAATLRAAGVAEVVFAPEAPPAALLAWASALAAGSPATGAGCPGVHTVPCATGDGGPVATGQRRGQPGGGRDAHLRAVFLQHRLIAGVASIPGLRPDAATLVVQRVVDRLLGVPGGLEPLVRLQQDERLLRRGITVAVLAVTFARRAGWPDERLADLGAAALLRDLGQILDPARPGPAAFQWLLQRGADDFWVRCALVARRAAPGSGDEPGAVAVARLAAAVADALPAAEARAVVPAWRRAEFVASLPPGLADVVPAELGGAHAADG